MAAAASAALAGPDIAGEGRAGLHIARLMLRVGHDAARPPPALPATAMLTDAIAGEMARRIDPSDKTLWVVRGLKVAGRAGSADPHAIAAAFARAMTAQLSRLLTGELTDGVCRYPSRSHWLADCLADHARGQARGDWRYQAHAALAALPFAMLPRALFAIETGQAPRVFAHLAADQRLAAVVLALGPRGVAATLPLLLSPAASAQPAAAEVAALAALIAKAPRALAAVPDGAMLWALATLGRDDPEVRRPGRATLEQARILAAQGRGAPIAVATVDLGLAPEHASQGAAATMESNDARPIAAAKVAKAALLAEPIETPFAGVFLLWRSVTAMGLDALLAEAGPSALLALAATLAGPDREAAWRDPALHWLAGYVPADDEPLPSPPAGLAAALAGALARWHAPRQLAPLLVPAANAAGRLHVVLDAASEDWLAVGLTAELRRRWPDARPPADAVAAALRDPVRDAGFFGLARNRAARPWALVARAAYADLARRLTGLEKSSAAWLWPNVLGGWGRVLPGRRAQIWLPCVPLDMVLRVVGIGGSAYPLPDGRSVELLLPGAG